MTNTPETLIQDILPQDPTKAVNDMIMMSRSLVKIAERESQALAQNDLISLAILQDEKERTTQRYQQASSEFRARIVQFRAVENILIDQLKSLQKQLNEIMSHNNALVLQIRDKAQQSTQETLLTAQELGQDKMITYGQTAWNAPESNDVQITQKVQ